MRRALLMVATAVIGQSTSACLTLRSNLDACQAELDKTKTALSGVTSERDMCKAQGEELAKKDADCQAHLTTAMAENGLMAKKLTSMNQNVDQLLGEKDQMDKERQGLNAQLEELRRLRLQSDARSAEYRKLLEKLHKMIDAGTLQVKVRSGRMLVQMSSDLLFPPGGTKLKPDAKKAVIELAQTIKQFTDRKFQVVGHSDSTPINTAKFPSNWELSAERAIEVAKVMIDTGVSAEMLSAAGQSEYDPLEPNGTVEHKTANRRVELVFLPKIDELPGFSEALSQR